MKFILGFHPTIKSPLDPSRPLLWFQIKAKYADVEYSLERLKRNEQGVVLPELQVYDSSDYPEPVIKQWLRDNHIVEWHGVIAVANDRDEARERQQAAHIR